MGRPNGYVIHETDQLVVVAPALQKDRAPAPGDAPRVSPLKGVKISKAEIEKCHAVKANAAKAREANFQTMKAMTHTLPKGGTRAPKA